MNIELIKIQRDLYTRVHNRWREYGQGQQDNAEFLNLWSEKETLIADRRRAFSICIDHYSSSAQPGSTTDTEYQKRIQALIRIPILNSVEEIWQEMKLNEVKKPLPKILQLRKDKELVVSKVYVKPSWSKEQELQLHNLLKESGVSGKTRNATQDLISNLRDQRKQEGTITYTLARGPYTQTETCNSSSPLSDSLFKGYRALRNQISHERTTFSKHLHLEGGAFGHRSRYVYLVPGSVTLKKKAKKWKVVQNNKVPEGKEKFLGIEIEFICKLSAIPLIDLFDRAGLLKYITLKTDGSLRKSHAADVPHELCILVSEQEYMSVVPKICAVLKAAGGYVNNTCGLHVHLDMRYRKPELAYDRLMKSINILYFMTPVERRYNKHCLRNPDDMPFTPRDGNRYWAINASAYSRHKTIEIRLHTGTVNSMKIVNWITLLLTIINTDNQVRYNSLTSFFKDMRISKDLRDYIYNRYEKFHTHNTANDEEMLSYTYQGRGRITSKCECETCEASRATVAPAIDINDLLQFPVQDHDGISDNDPFLDREESEDDAA